MCERVPSRPAPSYEQADQIDSITRGVDLFWMLRINAIWRCERKAIMPRNRDAMCEPQAISLLSAYSLEAIRAIQGEMLHTENLPRFNAALAFDQVSLS